MIIIGELINASRKAIKAALAVQNGTPLINSISLEKERYEKRMPIIAAEALAGRDNFCMNYLKAFRAGMFEG